MNVRELIGRLEFLPGDLEVMGCGEAVPVDTSGPETVIIWGSQVMVR